MRQRVQSNLFWMGSSATNDGTFRLEQQHELELVADVLGPSSRSATLLRYLAGKCFAGAGDQPSEYEIATEVFGRSKSKFDPSEDAIVRVEIHRLRKKLKEYYGGAGKGHHIRVTIPHGSYLPVFERSEAVQLPEVASTKVQPPESSVEAPLEPPSSASRLEPVPRNRHLWFYLLVPAVLLVAVLFAVIGRRHRAGPASGASVAAAPQTAARPGVPFAPVPLRLLAGYDGAPETDTDGRVWGPDKYVHGGGPWRRLDDSVTRTSDPMMFQQCRIGDFHYDIPLRPGIYELHLYFVTPGSSLVSPSAFNLRINGDLELSGFDINEDAMGPDIADERVFRDISPAKDGFLHLAFASETGAPELNALEIVPGIQGRQLPIRVTTRSSSYTDDQGNFWQADNYFLNGHLSSQAVQTTGVSDQNLFDTERYGHFSYAIPAIPSDRYTVILYFAELYFGPKGAAGGGSGSRVFKVMCNGQTLLDHFDIYKEAGPLHVLVKSFHDVRPSAQGKINLTFEPIVNNATVSGIQVLDDGE